MRAVVLTGAGDRAFIGGADLNELGGLCADSARLFITRLHYACKAIRECPVPVIGRINGFCLGAGLEVAASCDFRAAAEGARFGMPEVVMGLPSVIEAALLPGLIGWGRTREMLLTGAVYSARRGAGHALRREGRARRRPRCRDRAVARRHLAAQSPRPCGHRRRSSIAGSGCRCEEGIYAGIDALSEAYKTGEPQAAITAFFAGKKKRK